MKEKNIIYTDSPNEGLWTSKTALLPTHYPINVVYVTKGRMNWTGKTWALNIRGLINPGEVIEVVGTHTRIKYRVYKNLGAKTLGWNYSIKKIDDQPITSVDIDNAKDKTRINIMGRKSSKEIWDTIYEL